MADKQSTIDELNTNIVELQKTNVQLTADATKCNKDLKTAQDEATACKATNVDLTNTIKSINEKLSSCINDRDNDAKQINSLQCTIDDTKKALVACQAESTKCAEALKVEIADDTEMEAKLREEIALVRSTNDLLSQCTAHNADLEATNKNQSDKIAELTQKIADINAECDVSSKKLQEEIDRAADNLDQCKASLKSETDQNASIEIELKNSQLQITVLEGKLSDSQKVSRVH